MSRAVTTKSVGKTFAKALLASASLVAIGSPSAFALCTATNQAIYDGCATVGAWTGDPAINVTIAGTIVHDGLFAANIGGVPGTLRIFSGSTLHDTGAFGGGFFNTGVALTIDAGGFLIVDGADATGTNIGGGFFVDTFASLAGAGTLTVTTPGPGFGVIFGGNNVSTAFSGTVVMPNLGNFLGKTGTGTFTINSMTMAEGELLDGTTGGGVGLIHSSGTANIKAIAVGTGVGNNIMTMSGGTLNIVGTGGVGVPCGGNCPALRVGDFFGTGVLNHSAGSINIGTTGIASSLNVGNQSGNGTYNLSGTGVLNLGVLGDPNSAGLYGIGRQASGSVSHNGATTTGLFNQTGGTVNVNAGEFIVGDRDAGGAAGVITNSTLTISGGTFSVKAGANLWLSAVDNAAATDSTTNISGTGVLEIGDGSLKDAYIGGTGVYAFNLGGGAGGTIRVIGSNLVTTVNANLTGATALTGIKFDSNGFAANQWNGNLSGTGWLVKTGAGVLSLGGANTYMGGTAFNGGIVIVDGLTDLGDNSSAMSFNGGTLQMGLAGVLAAKAGGTNMAGAGTIDTNGFSTTYNGAITGAGALTKVGLGTLDLGGTNNSHTGALNINAGTLIASVGGAIGNTSAVTVAGGATLTIAASETIGSLAGTGAVGLGPNSLTTGGNNSSTSYTGAITGAGGNLNKTGTGTMTTAGLAYTGLTSVNGGILRVNGTVADGVTVNAGGTFGGNATVTGNLTNNVGGIVAPGNSPGTTAVLGNYIGGGSLTSEVIFNSAGAPTNGTTHDFLNITGTASGVTTINVVAFAPSNAPTATLGNGIELVRVGGVPTLGAGNFVLGAPVVQGGYQYVLTYRQDYSAALDGYFLTSVARQEVFGAAAAQGASALMRNSCSSARRRTDPLTGKQTEAWLEGSTGSFETGADTGLVTDTDQNCVNGGVSSAMRWNDMRVGVSVSGVEADTDVITGTGAGVLEGTSASGEVFVMYATNDVFASLAVGYADQAFEFKAPVSGSTQGQASGVYFNGLLGFNFDMGSNVRMTLSGALDYSTAVLEAGSFGLVGLAAAEDQMTATLQAQLKANFGNIKPYASVSLESFLTDSAQVNYLGATASAFSGEDLATGTLGVNASLTSTVDAFIEAQYKSALDVDATGQAYSAGLRIVW